MINGARALQNATEGLSRTAESIAREPLEVSRERIEQAQQPAAGSAVAATPNSDPAAASRQPSDLQSDLVDLKVYQRQAEAAAVVIQRSDSTVGTLLDTFA